jgi:c-di-GMP-binding flagellar brake protein YcgR
MSTERRQYERYPKYLGIRYKLSNGTEKLSMTQNISLGGIAFLAENSMPMEQPVELQILRGEGEKPVPATVKILRQEVRSDACVVAGAFSAIRDTDRTELVDFIQKYEN